MKTFKVLIILSVLSFFLSGCSVYMDLYFINKTENDVELTIITTDDVEKLKERGYKLQLNYVNEIVKVNDKTIDQLSEKNMFKVIDSKTIKIKLPPKSTTLVGGGYNGIAWEIDKFIILKNQTTKIMTTEELASQTEKTGGAIPPFHFTYVVE